MGISKIGSLFAANVDPVPAVKETLAVTPQTTAAQSASEASNEAVVVSNNLQASGSAPPANAEAAQAAKVQRLKEEVQKGAYKPDSGRVATAILRDLA